MDVLNNKVFLSFSLNCLGYQRQIRVLITQGGENIIKNVTIYKNFLFFFRKHSSIPINLIHNKLPSLIVWRHTYGNEKENL